MDLKNFTKHLIYQSANTQIPDNFSRFQICLLYTSDAADD